MSLGRQLVIASLVLILALGAGCKKRKPVLPAQTQAPTLAVPMPDQIGEAPPPPEPAPPEPEVAVAKQPKPKPQGHHHPRKPAQPPAASEKNDAAGNTTMAAARPPANPATEAPLDTAIGADVSSEQVIEQKQTTAQLIDATEKDLNSLPRNLNRNQKATVIQIKSYLTQSRKATTDFDFERAYNLANKAHLLSEALVKK
jgi:hypothetical protein